MCRRTLLIIDPYPYTVEVEYDVMTSVVGTLVVIVLQGGVDVTDEVCVTVEIARTLLQKGVTTL